MGDCVAAVTASGAEYPHRKLRIKSIDQLALVIGLLDEEDAIVSREQICGFCNVRRAAVDVFGTVHVIRCRWRPLARQFYLHGTLWPSGCFRVVVQARNDSRSRAVPRYD